MNSKPSFSCNATTTLKQTGSQPAKAILVAGKPLREPIVQYGPFVMNTREEIYKALRDFREGHLAGTR